MIASLFRALYDPLQEVGGIPLAREQRRLAAIIAADVVGYSRLMGRDESGTLARLRDHRKQRFEPTLARHGGRLVKLTGDGALAEFGSAVDALGAAIEFQQTMAEANRGQSEDTAIVFRIGLHLGDLIVDGDDLYGDGVNVAARLEAEAPAGGIVISRSVRDAVVGRLSATFADLGSLALKNIERPTRAFRVEWDPAQWNVSTEPTTLPTVGTAPQPADVPLILPDKPSIAVLPFQNMSGNPEQEYFVDGLVEDVTTALSRIRSFFVIARNSSFTYKGKAVDVRQVGRELGVRYILEGSVRKAGNRLRITGQLIDTATGNHIWAERYDGAVEDAFDLQDNITSSVAGAIEPRLQEAEIRRAQAKPTTDLTAHDYYLRALALLDRLTEDSVTEALVLLDRAIAIDAGHSSAHGLVSLCYVTRAVQLWGDVDEARNRAMEAAKRASETGRDDPFALALAGNGFNMAGRPEEGLAQIERALELNPNSATAWSIGGWSHCYLGNQTKSVDYFDKAIRLSPIDLHLYRSFNGIGFAHFFLGNYDTAISYADRALRDRPNWLSALSLKIVALVLANRIDEAQETIGRLRILLPGLSQSTYFVARPWRQQAMRELLESAWRKAGLLG